MVLCICKGVTEKDVVDLINTGTRVKDIVTKTGVGKDCGSCVFSLKELCRQKEKESK